MGMPCMGKASNDASLAMRQPRYSDIAAVFEGVRDLLGWRDKWTPINGAFVTVMLLQGMKEGGDAIMGFVALQRASSVYTPLEVVNSWGAFNRCTDGWRNLTMPTVL